MKNINWQTRDDGVIHFDPKGFEGAYYIYPVDYDENKDVQVSIINNSGQVLSSANFASIEAAQAFAINHMKNIIDNYYD